MQPIIRARSLRKRFGAFTAVDGIDFEVLAGECFGMLGPNGAGKTSTIRMTTCTSPPSDGTLEVCGLDVRTRPREIKAQIGVVAQDDNLDEDVSVRKNLITYARYFDIPRRAAEERADEVLALFQLEDKKHGRVNDLSGGMKRRLTIARALMGRPRLLVLDEPTTGLDPQARHVVWRQLRSLRDQGITLLLTTHYMDEAARLCDRLVIMYEGHILVTGRPQDLIREHAGYEVVEGILGETHREELLTRLSAAEGVRVEIADDTLYLYTDGPAAQLVAELGLSTEDVLVRRANLEDVFLKLTGRGLLD
jgi:lipooligosaccharide transport system ATP-binding protein